MVRLVAVAWLLVALAWRAAADGPLSPPADYTVYSPSRGCHAFLDAKNKRTAILQPTRGGSPNRLWEMPEWFRVAALSDDCEHLATGFDGVNLLPLDFKHDLVMLSFYERGKLLRAVKLDEVIRDFTKLRRTVSHYYWGQYLGFGERNRLGEPNRYIVETVEGQRIAFDVATGQPLSARPK